MALSYPPNYPKIEFKFEPIERKESNITRVYGSVSTIPQFRFKGANETLQMLVNLIGANPTHAFYFCEGASARHQASKDLQSLFWIDNVALFKCIELNRDGRFMFTITIGKSQLQNGELREPFKSRLLLNNSCVVPKIEDSFATFINVPLLAMVKKNSIHYANDLTQKRDQNMQPVKDNSMITVEAYAVEKALKIWIAFLDESRHPNDHIKELFETNMSIKDLCRLLRPLALKFRQ